MSPVKFASRGESQLTTYCQLSRDDTLSQSLSLLHSFSSHLMYCVYAQSHCTPTQTTRTCPQLFFQKITFNTLFELGRIQTISLPQERHFPVYMHGLECITLLLSYCSFSRRPLGLNVMCSSNVTNVAYMPCCF